MNEKTLAGVFELECAGAFAHDSAIHQASSVNVCAGFVSREFYVVNLLYGAVVGY